ncbi:DUF3182 family protein [Fulvimonas sp. R45]|uniref:DUF3182 family protein n=1 Tax=Fulvimonas sp. R45 TaxID=3045937 RepID=UPI00265F194B|nr:DUF3182 family protein [Fulvimonas sp. R45]MDO1528803.1 DUF3182 family protein [Fulvimonas sp. R45]
MSQAPAPAAPDTALPGPSRAARGTVVLGGAGQAAWTEHETVCHAAIARRLATLLGADFAGHYVLGQPYAPPLYFVPADVVVGLDVATAHGIRGAADLYGGVVPHGVVATKAITHPLVDAHAAAPDGWSHDFPQQVAAVALPGYSAFSREDALRAGRRLLARGPVRLKPALGRAGRGQQVAGDEAQLQAALSALPPGEPESSGLVLEADLLQATTYSVGEVRVGDSIIAYHGTQRHTFDNRGELTYGGSDLHVCRGDLDELLARTRVPTLREAIAQARSYDRAARACFPAMFASRRNYDVVQGVDRRGNACSGVLESSWRIGGASGAEVAALLRLRQDPGCTQLRVRAVERYGRGGEPPPGADILFRGTDPEEGELLKYVSVETGA